MKSGGFGKGRMSREEIQFAVIKGSETGQWVFQRRLINLQMIRA